MSLHKEIDFSTRLAPQTEELMHNLGTIGQANGPTSLYQKRASLGGIPFNIKLNIPGLHITVHCTLYIVHYTSVYILHCTLYIVHCTSLYSLHSPQFKNWPLGSHVHGT